MPVDFMINISATSDHVDIYSDASYKFVVHWILALPMRVQRLIGEVQSSDCYYK